MTTKLIDMNVGIQLTLLVDGKQKMVTWSAVCPSHEASQPIDTVLSMIEFLNEQIGTGMDAYTTSIHPVQIAKPKRIKAHRAVSQEEFNKRIKELQP